MVERKKLKSEKNYRKERCNEKERKKKCQMNLTFTGGFDGLKVERLLHKLHDSYLGRFGAKKISIVIQILPEGLSFNLRSATPTNIKATHRLVLISLRFVGFNFGHIHTLRFVVVVIFIIFYVMF